MVYNIILLQEAAAAPNPHAKTDPPSAGGKHDFGTSSHYKLNIRRGGAKMPFKPQSLSSPSHHVDKSLMFEGLDDLESSTAGTFKPRKNFKKLVIPPHSPRPVSVCVCVCVCVRVRAYVCACACVYCLYGINDCAAVSLCVYVDCMSIVCSLCMYYGVNCTTVVCIQFLFSP